ncbi:MAG TPA: hypothetical protein VKQ30_13040 [Ktedonobacterales bacterium]|nr:hypothetical protein [Ktedonobacterales bacterium]
MALKSGLTLYCYTLPYGGVPYVVPYSDELQELQFTTVMPGGFGALDTTIRLSGVDARLPQPQLALFSHVALMDGLTCLFRGEIMESAYILDPTYGDAVRLTALGIGNQLRDDPYDISYSGKTAQQIVFAELQFHGSNPVKVLPQISQDTSLIFPDNPAGTYSPSYDGRTMEEIVGDMAILAGIYDWAVWDHPTQRDSAGFPLGQLSVLLHDASTTHYQATLANHDIIHAEISFSGERAYNFISVAYNTSSGGTSHGYASDPRLNSDGSQGTAPFRKRKYLRDLSGSSTIGGSQASAVASAFFGQLSNMTNKVSMVLTSINDAGGTPINLWTVRAGKNMFVPDLAVRGATLPTAATAGVNQFFIVSTTYQENQTSAQLTLQMDNYTEYAERQVARLQLAADQQARGQKFASLMQMMGAPQKAIAGSQFPATAAGQNGGGDFNWPTVLYQSPTSATITSISNTNATGAAYSNLSVYGGVLSFQSVAAGDCAYYATLTSQGNTLHEINEVTGTFDWHCSGCDTLHEGLDLRRDMEVRHHHASGVYVPSEPGHTSLTVECASCGLREGFNAALTSADEDAQRCGEHHADQARRIRRLMRALGLAVLP